MRAIQIREFGGPEVLQVTELPDPLAADGQVLITVERSGINYADTHQAENTYLAPATLPLVPGAEVGGRTSDGSRVVALMGSGGYAQLALAKPDLTFAVPENLELDSAVALLLQGTTAWHLLRTSARMAPGESVVVHAAAGGVGTLALQLAREMGAGRIIATASSPDKRQLAMDLGADVAVDVNQPGLAAALVAANGGRRVDVVLEMTGGPVFDQSLEALAPFGRLVTYGMASRQAPSPIMSGLLMARSQAVVGFWLMHCMKQPSMLRTAMDELFRLVEEGRLRPVIGGVYPLAEAGQAHRDLRSRASTGKLLLDPSR